jgi:hypothetical protein
MMKRVRMEDGDGTGCNFFVFSNAFSLGWYYQPRLKGVCVGAGEPLLLSRLVTPTGTKGTI